MSVARCTPSRIGMRTFFSIFMCDSGSRRSIRESNLSDFGHLRVPNSGKPEFGWEREQTELASGGEHHWQFVTIVTLLERSLFVRTPPHRFLSAVISICTSSASSFSMVAASSNEYFTSLRG